VAPPAAPFPLALSEFIVWAGEVLSGDSHAEAAGSGSTPAPESYAPQAAASGASAATSVEQAAHRILGTASSAATGRSSDALEPTASGSGTAGEDDCCSICQDGLADAEACEAHGEPLMTACGHRFHAICYARFLEASREEPVCPMCRSGNLSARFLGRA